MTSLTESTIWRPSLRLLVGEQLCRLRESDKDFVVSSFMNLYTRDRHMAVSNWHWLERTTSPTMTWISCSIADNLSLHIDSQIKPIRSAYTLWHCDIGGLKLKYVFYNVSRKSKRLKLCRMFKQLNINF